MNFSKEVRLELAEEWQFANENNVEDDSTGPNVGRRPVVRLLSHDVWVHVVRCSAENAQLLVGGSLQTETEIDNFNRLGRRVHQDVVKLEVSVSVPFVVQVVHSLDQLSKDVLAGLFGQSLVRLLLYVVEDAGPLAHLHDQVHMGPLIDHLVKFHN